MTTIQLTGHQRAVLTMAAYSTNLLAWPLPKRLKLSKGSTTIVVKGLLRKGLVEERPALGNDPIWRETEDGKALTLVVTKAGLAAVGMTPANAPSEKAADAVERGPTAPVSENQRPMPRAGSKLATLVALLGRKEGATVEEMVPATGWQAHTVRGVMSGALAKKFGLQIGSEKVEGRGRVYRAMSSQAE
jgi:hypothetical protein